MDHASAEQNDFAPASPQLRTLAEHEHFRDLMGRWASGVTVVTSRGADGVAGCTASAFSSVSLDPMLLLVCLDVRSRTLEAIRESGRFGISILSAGQQDVALTFATKAPEREKFASVAWSEAQELPMLHGALAHLACELESSAPGGDHVVLVGRLAGAAWADDADPLLYFRGAFASFPERRP